MSEHRKRVAIELFPCAGGMAEGFRRVGIHFDIAVELMPDHCASYEKNLGHKPWNMDARDFLRALRDGHINVDCYLLVADPPCTPWSHAGKRQGTADDRDMLVQTCEIIRLLRPDAYLIGNVPGLDEAKNLPIVQKHIGGLSDLGYCTADFARLDAAAFGVPQRRWRPFWFGHRMGTKCLQWPLPTHGDPADNRPEQLVFDAVPALVPFVTCRQALGHLDPDDIGRPVRVVRKARGDKSVTQIGEVTVRDETHAMSDADKPARTMTKNTHGDGAVVIFNDKHPATSADAPANTIRGGGDGHSAPQNVIVMNADVSQSMRIGDPNKPAKVITAKEARVGTGEANVLAWPWDRPSTTVTNGDRLPPPGHHDENSYLSFPGAIVISEKAAAILQGFPESWVFVGKTKKARWSQIGQAMPPPLAAAVAFSVKRQMEEAMGMLPITPIESARRRT